MLDRRTFLGAGLALTAMPFATRIPALAFPADVQQLDAMAMTIVPPAAIDPAYKRQLVPFPDRSMAGTMVIDTHNRFLYLVRDDNTAIRYGVGVGRDGFRWRGVAFVGDKKLWPTWRPPSEMRARQPYLPEMMEGGLDNPLGARALYLHRADGSDTLYRVHGTNEPHTIGQALSSGCIRMLNSDVMDLYRRVPVGTRVTVLASSATHSTGVS